MVKKLGIYIKLSLLFMYIRKQQLSICGVGNWKRAFFNFLCNIQSTSYDYTHRWQVVEGFAKSNISIIKKANRPASDAIPILICVVLNEMERMKVFLEHYRKTGIKRFAVLDNGSTDGTIEYLKQQDDVELFQTKDLFESRIKMGWINRIIAYYGTSRWYLVVDADELLVWQGIEESDIKSVIRCLKKQKITRARALMVDMYPKTLQWNNRISFEEVYRRCRYFDSNTYYQKEAEEVFLLSGGPRKRMLGMEVWLTKYPLFQLKKNELLSNPHSIFPFQNRKTPCYLAVLHYKFLTLDDQRKMRTNARKGNYAGGSAEYKLYLQKLRESTQSYSFYYKDSEEYQSSISLSKIKEIDHLTR